MATVEDVAVAALARCGDLGILGGGTRSVLYRRASVRQRQLFSEAARRNPEYFGAVALGTLVNGAADIDTMLLSGVAECEAVYRVEIGDKGTSTFTNGDRVSLVSVNDAASTGLAPRVTIQGHVIRQVGTDLALVAKVKVYYATRPAALVLAADVVALPSPFDELLVLDLATWLIKTAEASDERKAALLPLLQGEEKDLIASFLQHLASFTQAFEGRYGGLR